MSAISKVTLIVEDFDSKQIITPLGDQEDQKPVEGSKSSSLKWEILAVIIAVLVLAGITLALTIQPSGSSEHNYI